MISVIEASNKAVEYLKQLYPNADNILLEEVESTEDKRYWNITLSYQSLDRTQFAWANTNRKLKIFKIDADSGEVLSMKIRELNA